MVKQYDKIEEYVSAVNKIANNDIWNKDKIRSNVIKKFSIPEVIKEYEKTI